MAEQQRQIRASIERYRNGLDRLADASAQVSFDFVLEPSIDRTRGMSGHR